MPDQRYTLPPKVINWVDNTVGSAAVITVTGSTPVLKSGAVIPTFGLVTGVQAVQVLARPSTTNKPRIS